MSSSAPLLEADGITFRYPDGTLALRDLSVRIWPGQKIAMLGANGSGKSTLFLHFGGVLRPTRGVVRAWDWSSRTLTRSCLPRVCARTSHLVR
jgi:ABC-type bacteriocin/lantibiotic exporter with double-glycine peptidase domain